MLRSWLGILMELWTGSRDVVMKIVVMIRLATRDVVK